MDRRQFIRVATAALPVPAFGASSADPACGIVRFGVITVGGIGRAILDDRTLNLPYRPRTIAINTDAAGLDKVSADRKILVGGGGVLPAHIADAVAGLEVAFLVAGMGGAAGTAISPVVAQVLRGQHILTLCYTISPFDWEGKRRQQSAQSGVRALRPHVDALIAVSNEQFAAAVGDDAPMTWVLQQAPNAFLQCCRRVMNIAAAPSGALGWRSRIRGLRELWV